MSDRKWNSCSIMYMYHQSCAICDVRYIMTSQSSTIHNQQPTTYVLQSFFSTRLQSTICNLQCTTSQPHHIHTQNLQPTVYNQRRTIKHIKPIAQAQQLKLLHPRVLSRNLYPISGLRSTNNTRRFVVCHQNSVVYTLRRAICILHSAPNMTHSEPFTVTSAT